MLGDELLGAIQRAAARAVEQSRQVGFGVVTATSPLTVRLNGDTAAVEVALSLDSYTPVTNDTVLLVRAGSDWIVVGDYS